MAESVKLLDYRLKGQGSIPSSSRDFPLCHHMLLIPCAFLQGISDQSLKLITHTHLVLKSGMHEALLLDFHVPILLHGMVLRNRRIFTLP
jgi:hypothetical protein